MNLRIVPIVKDEGSMRRSALGEMVLNTVIGVDGVRQQEKFRVLSKQRGSKMGSSAEIHLGDVYKISVRVTCKEGFEMNKRNTQSILHHTIERIQKDNADWSITMTANYNDENTHSLSEKANEEVTE